MMIKLFKLVKGFKEKVVSALVALIITVSLYCGSAIYVEKEKAKKLSIVGKLKRYFDRPLRVFVWVMISVMVLFLPDLAGLKGQMLKVIGNCVLIAITVIIMLCDKKLRVIAKENKRLFTVDFLIFMLTGKIYSLVFIKGFYSDMIYVEIPFMWLYAQVIGIFTAVLWVGVSFGFAYLFTDGKILDVLKDRYSEKIESIVKFADTVRWKAKRLVG